MARRFRRGKGRKGKSMAGFLKGKVLGIVFILIGAIVPGLITVLVNAVPDSYIIVSNGTLTVASSLPQGATGLNNKVIIDLIVWVFGILLVLSGIRRMGVKL